MKKTSGKTIKKKVLLIPLILAALIAAGCGIYLGTGQYSASEEAADLLRSTENVQVREVSHGLLLDGPGEDTALIFYPGGKVEYTSYLPLLHRLAGSGTDCFLIHMPANLAVFGAGRAERIQESYDYAHWYIGGHSLGGAMAADYAAEHGAKAGGSADGSGPAVDGLVLLAAYPVSQVSVPTLVLYGSEDRVLNQEKLQENTQYLPEDTKIRVIEGGNHAQFGDYGVQKGDGKASISREEQVEITAAEIKKRLP